MSDDNDKQKDNRRSDVTSALAAVAMALDHEIHGMDTPEKSEEIQSGLATAMVLLSGILKRDL